MAEVIVKEDAVEGVKEAPVKSPAAKTPPPSNATHTTAAGEETVAAGSPPGRGLSELARQLRVMQAKNQALTVEVGRLERQLRILSDLSGISVTDLRATLERACESEAYGELQHRLAKLQAQLEEAKLKQRNSTETFDREADAKTTANLQLRIGELEEAEAALRQELTQLYKSQDEQAEESAKLKSANDHQHEEMRILGEKISQMDHRNETLQEHMKELQASPRTAAKFKVTAPLPPLAGEEAEKKTKDPPAHTRSKKSPKKATKAKVKAPAVLPPPVALTVKEEAESKHVKLLRNQVESREKELELKESQYKTRFTFQEERIVDMEQQLSSLYTAFDLVNEDHTQEQQSKAELTEALRMADSQVAKAVDHLERSQPSMKPPPLVSPAPSAARSPQPYQSPPPGSVAFTPSKSSSSLQRSGSTPTDSLAAEDDVLVTGYVFKRGRLNRWKKQHASISRCFANFQLRLSDGPLAEKDKKKAKFLFLTVFRSSFEVVKDFPNYPHCFKIKIDQFDRDAPVLILAVGSENEFHEWLVCLHEAVDGTGGPQTPSATPATPMVEMPIEEPEESKHDDDYDAPADEDSDLDAALRESLRLSQDVS